MSATALLLLSLAAPGPVRAAQWVPVGPAGGSVRVLAAAPSDSRVIYAATGTPGTPGLYRSGDGGTTWQALALGSGAPRIAPRRFVVDPANPRHLVAGLYDAGTPDAEEAPEERFAGVFESADGGLSWAPASRGLPRPAGRAVLVRRLAFGPHDPADLFAATYQGLYVRRHGDPVWRLLAFPGVGVEEVAVDPSATGHLLAGINDFPGVFQSTDGGRTWAAAQTPNFGPMDLMVFDRARPSRVYGFFLLGLELYRSDDGGGSWRRTASNPPLPGGTPVTARALAAGADGVLYSANGSGVYASTDGDTWSPAIAPVTYDTRPRDAVTELLVLPGPPAVALAAGERGLWRSTDRGASWRPSSAGIAAHWPRSLLVDGDAAGTVLAGDVGLFRSADQGATWQLVSQALAPFIRPGEPSFASPVLAAAPSDPDVLYANLAYVSYDRTPNGTAFARSLDAGRTWSVVNQSVLAGAIAVHPTRPDTVYVAGPGLGGPFGSCNLLSSTDGGRHFQCGSVNLPLGLAIDPTRPDRLVGVSGEGYALRSDDAGASWIAIALPPAPGLRLLSLALDPVDSNVFFFGSQDGVYWTVDGGLTLRPRHRGLPSGGAVRSLVIDPANPAILYAGVGDDMGDAPQPPQPVTGVYRSTDRGGTWSLLGAGLPESFTGRLALDARHGLLYAATRGLGLYRLALP